MTLIPGYCGLDIHHFPLSRLMRGKALPTRAPCVLPLLLFPIPSTPPLSPALQHHTSSSVKKYQPGHLVDPTLSEMGCRNRPVL